MPVPQRLHCTVCQVTDIKKQEKVKRMFTESEYQGIHKVQNAGDYLIWVVRQ